jgi:hypothetical protein
VLSNPRRLICFPFVSCELRDPRLAPERSRNVPSRRSRRLAENGLARAERGEDLLGDVLAGETDLLAQERGLPVRDVAVGKPDAEDAGAPVLACGEGVLDVLEDGGAEAA